MAGKTATAAAQAARRRRRRKPAPATPAGARQTVVNPPRPGRFARIGLYGYIWATSRRAQVLLALLSIFIFLLDLVPLELQRRIVNEAIGQKAFAALI